MTRTRFYRIHGIEGLGRATFHPTSYTEAAIRERIAGTRVIASAGGSGGRETAPLNVSLLIDIQSKIQQGKGGGYAHWAKMFKEIFI